MSSASERRKRSRVPLIRPIRHTRYQVLGTPVFQENSALDLSASGVSFESSVEYKKGVLVLLEVEIEQAYLKVLVAVAWCKEGESGRYLLGGEIIAIDPEHKKKVLSYLSKAKKSQKKKKVKSKKPKSVKKVKKKKALPKKNRKAKKVKSKRR